MTDPGLLEPLLGKQLPWLYADTLAWTALGLCGNIVFSLRFVIQWLSSEKRKSVYVPPIFWHLSFWGSVLSLLYAFHLDKLPVILGYIALPALYGRNLILLRRSKTTG